MTGEAPTPSEPEYRKAFANVLKDDTPENRQTLIEQVDAYDQEHPGDPGSPKPWPAFSHPIPEPDSRDSDLDDQ